MAEHDLDELRAESAQATDRLRTIYDKLRWARDESLPKVGRTDDGALIVAGYLETYYTALETFFLRVSQYFENNLGHDRWHSELLENMNLAIEGLRERVVGDRTLSRLRELLRSRHFRSYYVEMEYDWTRIDFLLKVIDGAHHAVPANLESFGAFLGRLAERVAD